jgi:hypothetical protein
MTPRGARAQFELPQSLVTASPLDASQRDEIVKWVQTHVKDLTHADPEKVRAARQALLNKSGQWSVPFRVGYSNALAKPLADILASGGADAERAHVNALVIAGEIASGESLTLIRRARSSQTASVRFQAAGAAKRVFELTASGKAAIQSDSPDLARTVEEMAKVVSTEGDPLVADAALGAVSAAAMIEAQRPAAMESLANAVNAFVRAQKGTPDEGLIEALARTGSEVRAIVQVGRPSTDALKRAGDIGGSLLWHSITVVKAKSMSSDESGKRLRELYAQVAGEGAQLVTLSGKALDRTFNLEAPGLGDTLMKATNADDASFVDTAQRMIEALSRKPFEVAAARYR